MLREPVSGSAPLGERSIRRLVAAAQGGDREAMRDLYLALAPGVRAHVTRIVGGDDAEDVTQQVFAKLMTTELSRYRPGEAQFSAWLRRVARNLAIDHLRRNRTVPYAEVHDGHASAGDAAPRSASVLLEALGELPRAQRDVLLLHHLVGLSPAEIAARLGRSVHSVHCLHNRGRAAARVALGDAGAAPATSRPVHDEWRGPAPLMAA
jgi:RNA polymerase sigma-70 factor (ECF subfamily)